MTLHTDIPTRTQLQRLIAARDQVSVSVYVPTSPLTQQAQAGRIELKNLAAEATRQLEEAGADRAAATAVREELDGLVEDDDFWAEQAHSLAVFAAPGGATVFRLPNQLTSVVEVSDRFYVKPLLRAVTFPQAAFVLALASGSVRLVEVTRDGPAFTVDVPGLPSDAASAAGRASITERSPIGRLQGSEGQKVRLRQFARKVDQALRGVLTGLELPLILAATEPMDAIYRALNSYPHLAVPAIPGNPEGATDAELGAAARTVLDEVYERELAELRDLFEARFTQGRASADLATIARAATYGVVDTLVIDIDEKVPGYVDEASGAMTLAEDDASSYGVVDELARRVLPAGGRVLAVRPADVPEGGPAAAVLRYAF